MVITLLYVIISCVDLFEPACIIDMSHHECLYSLIALIWGFVFTAQMAV